PFQDTSGPSMSVLLSEIKQEPITMDMQSIDSPKMDNWNPNQYLHNLPPQGMPPMLPSTSYGPLPSLDFDQSSHLNGESGDYSKDETGMFKCNTCGIVCRFSCQIEQHVRMHTGERPFECEQCGKTYGRLSCLQQHRLIHEAHTDKPRFVCPTCEQPFTDRSNLRRHIKRQHGLICETCGESFDLF
ncbi:hypothetical protein PFISCL1PPCAC_10943, partial [Pristionchus fissidentatus]